MKTILKIYLIFIFLIFGGSVFAADCVKGQDVCLSPNETRNINGVQVTRACWEYQSSYSCLNSSLSEDDTCTALKSKGCYQTATACQEYDASGRCTLAQETLRCDSPASTATPTTCNTQLFCMDGSCFNMGYNADTDMPQAIALLEGMREAGTYMTPGTHILFDGESHDCRVRSLQSCCTVNQTSGGGGRSVSNQVAMSAVMSVAKYGYDYAKFKATPYVDDVLMEAKTLIYGAQAAESSVTSSAATTVGESAAAAAPSLTFEFMGFGWTSGAVTATTTASGATTGGGLLGGNVALGNAGFYFNPYAFAAAVAIMAIQQVAMCTPTSEEQTLSVMRGQNLCHAVGSYCSMNVLGACLEHKQTFCCFNSKLSRIINEQGRSQIGRGWGAAKSPDCAGFTLTDFQRLNFSTMDLSEFYSEVVPGYTTREGVPEDQKFWTDRATSRVGDVIKYQTPDVSTDPATRTATP